MLWMDLSLLASNNKSIHSLLARNSVFLCVKFDEGISEVREHTAQHSAQHTCIAVSARRYSISTKHSRDDSNYTTHTHTHTRKHTHTHTHTHTAENTVKTNQTTHHAFRFIYTRINIHKNIHKNIHVYIHTHTPAFACPQTTCFVAQRFS